MCTICWAIEQVLLSAGSGEETFGGAGIMTIYEVIKRPLVTEKGVAKKDDERTLCFEVARGRQQDRDQDRRSRSCSR